jgi:hypothetical protein
MNINNQVAVLELRRLLFELKDLPPDIFIRFRVLGEMWQVNFSQVVRLTEQGVYIFNVQTKEVTLLRDLNNVIQFEIDSAFQQYQPHDHYTVVPLKAETSAKGYASTGS